LRTEASIFTVMISSGARRAQIQPFKLLAQIPNTRAGSDTNRLRFWRQLFINARQQRIHFSIHVSTHYLPCRCFARQYRLRKLPVQTEIKKSA
jgi:hypothetical protein